MLKKIIKSLILLFILLFLFVLYILFYDSPYLSPGNNTFGDFSGISKPNIEKQIHIKKVKEIQDYIKLANKENKKIAIAGKKMSSGGHVFTTKGLVLDMSKMNNIIDYNPNDKIITIESGITWGEIQRYIAKDNLAIKVMQSSNIFSVGGSLSSNIHGRDPRYSSISDIVKSFEIILSNGEKKMVTYQNNPKLFSLVLSGYGLFGVITQVTLELVEDENYEIQSTNMKYTNYSDYIKNTIKNNDNIGLHYGRLSIVPGKNFLRDFYITNFIKTNKKVSKQLQLEKNIYRNRFFFNLSRKYKIGKYIRWNLQKSFTEYFDKKGYISRNNAMNPPIRFISYKNKNNTDTLQEYFIPVDNFSKFTDDLRKIIQKNNINLLNVTTRYIKPTNQKSFLHYNTDEVIAIVLYVNINTSDKGIKKAKKWTNNIIESALKNNGSFYLTYDNFYTKKNLLLAYPNFGDFVNNKYLYDKKRLFMNRFFEIYSIAE